MIQHYNLQGRGLRSLTMFYPRQNEPLLPLPDILPPAIALYRPRPPLAIRVHLVYRLHLESLLRYHFLEERRQFRAASVEPRYAEYTCVGRLGEEVKHRLCQVLVLPRHPQTVGCEDTGIAVRVGGLEGRGCATPLVAVDSDTGLEPRGNVLCDVCLEGIEDG
jgi:hypothetical protein